MRVNSAFTGLFNNRLVVGSGIAIVMLAIFFIASSFTKRSDRDLRAKQVNIIIREIGHRLLLQAGDRSSRVLPVREIKEGTFLIRFENEFVFNHDSLMTMSQRLLPETEFPSGYTVTVHECDSPAIVYGFEINPPNNSIMPCKGRNQPKACYNIEIAFADFSGPTVPYVPIAIILGGIPLLLAFILIGRSKKSTPPAQQHAAVENEIKPVLTIGGFVFDSTNQSLRIGEEAMLLTDKECKILTLLNRNIGQLTLREELIQEVWTDEGVITGRSLDMFISKLRKKLSGDPDLRITNVHGKGYRLEIANDSTA